MKMRTAIRSTVVVLAAMAGLVLAGASPAAAASYANCAAGNVCFYTGSGGSGSMCSWSDADTDWSAGAVRCSWARSTPARSVYNNGRSTAYTAVAWYTSPNYVPSSYNGCMGRTWSGNIGPVYVLSHKWITGAC